ncbi:MAG: sporulation protein [Dorea sp.]|nr:sporulation protein [Dorea sp.]MCI9272284.1 sporulation protein [Dorea sp.]
MCGFFMREKNSTSGEKRFLGQMSDMSGMPKDVTLGAPILTVTGQMELLVENYRGILEYTECLIRIQTKIGQIRILGTRLTIEYYTSDEMKIMGKVTDIKYVN